MTVLTYKILRASEWAEMGASASFDGAPVDLADGYIHLSYAHQVAGTLSRHFTNPDEVLFLLEIDTTALAGAMKVEPSSRGELFPHLYAPLPLAAVRRWWGLPCTDTGQRIVPDLEAG
jgi:uncharacterized protein (DUF952 family)